CGLEIELIKKVKPGSGLGSSASSAAGAVVGVNALLEAGLRPDELIPFALDGEELASGARHSDNVAPAVLGGLVLSGPDGSIKQIPAPRDWHLVLLHPQITIRTSEARAVLPESVPLKDAVRQSALFATFIAACFEGNGAEAALNMDDLLVGPHRQGLIPHFKQMREASMGSGARAMGIAGSGPSSFHIAMSREDAHVIASKLSEIMKVEAVPFELYITEISLQGARVIS
ncbi:MAG: homoserine kinase, partial [Flavobacteriales bacterium]